MGVRHPRTKNAWNNLNQRFGKCPNCGTEPFEDYSALKSYSPPVRALAGVMSALHTGEILTIVAVADELVDFSEYISKTYDTDSTGLARISSAVIQGNSDLSNIKLEDRCFTCNNCGETWDPGKWEVTFTELGLTAYQY